MFFTFYVGLHSLQGCYFLFDTDCSFCLKSAGAKSRTNTMAKVSKHMSESPISALTIKKKLRMHNTDHIFLLTKLFETRQFINHLPCIGYPALGRDCYFSFLFYYIILYYILLYLILPYSIFYKFYSILFSYILFYSILFYLFYSILF